MSKNKSVLGMILILLTVFLSVMAGCAPAPENGCNTLKTELNRAYAEVAKLQTQLNETKTELDKAKAEIAKVKSASLDELLRQRRSIRSYADAPLTKDEVMKLLWAGQGITAAWGGRTAPSAGALYPLELYVAIGNVEGLAPGVYKYDSRQNKLNLVNEGDVRSSLAQAALGQSCVRDGAINIVIAAVYKRTTAKYGARGERYVHIEVGHAAQNICLEATSLGLGLVTVGAFDDTAVAKIMSMSADEVPLYVIPVGRIK